MAVGVGEEREPERRDDGQQQRSAEHLPPVEAVGEVAGRQGEQNDGQHLREADASQRERRIGALVQVPADRYRLELRPHARAEVAGEEQAEVAHAQGGVRVDGAGGRGRWANYAGQSEVRDIILAGRINPFQAIDFGLADRIPAIVRERPWQLETPFREYGRCEGLADQRPAPWHTPLWWAITKKDAAAARALLENGALQPPDPDGRTPLAAAREAGQDEIADLLGR